jgi:hypothetical protein
MIYFCPSGNRRWFALTRPPKETPTLRTSPISPGQCTVSFGIVAGFSIIYTRVIILSHCHDLADWHQIISRLTRFAL